MALNGVGDCLLLACCLLHFFRVCVSRWELWLLFYLWPAPRPSRIRYTAVRQPLRVGSQGRTESICFTAERSSTAY